MNEEQAAKLRKPFPKSAIGKLPKGGVMLDYVGHAATTDRLLEVDPEWSWAPFALDEHGLPALDAAGNLWINLTICGVTRPGVGDGRTMKERIGDALRNAAMRFGVALDLWAKEDLQGGQDATAAPQERRAPASDTRPAGGISDPQLKKMGALMRELKMTDRDAVLRWVGDVVGRAVSSRNDLTMSEAKAVIDALVKAQQASVRPDTGEVVGDDSWVVKA